MEVSALGNNDIIYVAIDKTRLINNPNIIIIHASL